MGTIETLARKNGLESAYDLCYAARIAPGTAYKFWEDDFSDSKFKTVIKVKEAIGATLEQMEAATSRKAEATE
jgi:hypothetical protein